ncbi:MAG: tRNA (adenosine(37)-N6)-threonylcarbamoyltransferase complex ATPase subunit type 1 TsaE [Patescibacteria group bacterium]|mgnify:CR=1 FL=1
MEPLEIHSKNLEDTKRAAEILLEKIGQSGENSSKGPIGAIVVGLYGDLGAGKTAFTQFFGELLGVREKIASPTFVLEKIYKIENSGDDSKVSARNFSHLIHIDAYRFESEKEMENLGWKEIAENPQNIILVEWPERIAGLMPENHTRIYFDHVDGGENETARKITFKNVAE